LSPEWQHERFEEMAAMAAIGELPAPEFEELREHVTSCYRCREVSADFARIASTDLGLLAVESGGPVLNDSPEQLDEAALLANIRAKAMLANPMRVEVCESLASEEHKASGPWFDFSRLLPQMSYAAAVVIVIAGSISLGYLLRNQHSRTAIAKYEGELAHLRQDSEQDLASRQAFADALSASKSQLQELTSKLQQAEAEQTRLLGERDELQQRFASLEAARQQVQNELKDSESRHEIEARVRNDLQQELLEAKDRIDAQNATVTELRAKLENSNQAASPSELAAGNVPNDARQLFGARDLHIVDVYDVDTNGKTKRTYGRVYYVEKKLLVFYAFDLQDKKGSHDAVGFQAWGYREVGERKPENLGLFRLEDPSANRWVLQVNNPHVLEKIDAVYVTAEPRDGSSSPRGRRLLYANLVSPPNHP
jgi:hypothetical protein